MIATQNRLGVSGYPCASRVGTSIVLISVIAGLLTGCESAVPAAAEKKYAFWPPAPDTPRVQFLTSFQKASDNRISQQGKLDEFLYGKENKDDLPILKPYGVAWWDGRIYVTDLRGTGIVVLDLKKRETRLMGSRGTVQIKRAVDICIAPDGTKYVADLQQNAVLVFDSNERFVKIFTATDLHPAGVAIRGEELFIADIEASVIKVVDAASGQLRRTIGGPGTEDGKFGKPLALTHDAQGNLYVVDVLKCRVQKFNPKGEFLLGFGQVGARAGDFVRPKHMAVTADGTLYVTDAAFNNVQAFDEQGLVMGYFGALGDFPGAMDLPAGLAVVENPADIQLFAAYIHPDFQAEKLLIVSNQFGPNKVAVYAQGQLRPGKTLSDINAVRVQIKEEAPDRSKSPDVITTQPIDAFKP